MAKDDYFVIVYQILTYMYRCLKDGKQVDVEVIKPTGKIYPINDKYWEFIICSLIDEGYIQGAKYIKNMNGDARIYTDDISITVKGIEFLMNNSTLEKVKLFMKDLKDCTPFM